MTHHQVTGSCAENLFVADDDGALGGIEVCMKANGRVPARLQEAYQAAETCVRRYFDDEEVDHQKGTIKIGGERYVLVRTEGLATEYFEDLVRMYADVGPDGARRMARGLVFDLGYKVGRSDARSLVDKDAFADAPSIVRVLAGTVQFAYTGGSRVDIHQDSMLTSKDDFVLIYDLDSSFEADERGRHGTTEEEPSCAISGGYLSGWCEAVVDAPVVATEILCRAKGDPVCRFVVAMRDEVAARVAAHLAHEPDLAARVTHFEIPRPHEHEREREEMHGLVAHLKEAQRARSAMLREIAHDVSTPVTSLYLQAWLLKRRAVDDPEIAETVNVLQESIGRLAQFVRDLKDVSAMEEGQTRIHKRPVDVLRVVERTLGVVRTGADHMGVGLQVTSAGAVNVDGDPARLGQLMRILLSNALKFSHPGQEVHVDLRRTGAEVEVSVRDRGRGIEGSAIGRIFRPFEQVHDPGTTPYKGSGLGLYIARWIVEEHGGTIHATSAGPGKGATFTVRLPVSAHAAESGGLGKSAGIADRPSGAAVHEADRRGRALGHHAPRTEKDARTSRPLR